MKLDMPKTSFQFIHPVGDHWEKVKKEPYITGYTEKGTERIPLVSSRLNKGDRLGIIKVRWGIGRMNYTIAPGLYGIGDPDSRSPVMVTANYKMTFDRLRQDLDGMNAWILVLDTKGINVWCAAGKGTFGTRELIRQIETTRLKEVVDHHTLIVPQLGAPGVAAHEVKSATGFKVKYGPVYSRDIQLFFSKGTTVSPEMRQVHFGLKDRAVLIPMELIPAFKYLPVILLLIVAVHLVNGSGFSSAILIDLTAFIGAIVVGAVLFQILLPWIPFRSFALKGWLLGLVYAAGLNSSGFAVDPLANYLMLPPVSAFLALNFTGSTTYTSLSGVQKEIRYSTPAVVIFLLGGIILKILK